MGQQQLLLVILVTIIVGIATVVAINIFGTAAEQANKDAIRQDLLAASAQAQGIWSRPVMMGGAGGDFSDDTTLPDQQFSERLGIPGSINDLEVTNENAVYTINRSAADVLEIEAVPTGSSGTWTLTVTRQTGTGASAWLITIEDGDGQTVTLGNT